MPLLDVAKCKLYAPFYKNTQGLVSGTRRIRNQPLRLTQNRQKTLYMSQNTAKVLLYWAKPRLDFQLDDVNHFNFLIQKNVDFQLEDDDLNNYVI